MRLVSKVNPKPANLSPDTKIPLEKELFVVDDEFSIDHLTRYGYADITITSPDAEYLLVSDVLAYLVALKANVRGVSSTVIKTLLKLKQENEEFHNNNKELLKIKSELEEQVNLFSDALKEKDKDFQYIEKQLEERINMYDELYQNFTSLEQKYETAMDERDGEHAEVESCNRRISELESEISNLESEIDDLEGKLSDAESRADV